MPFTNYAEKQVLDHFTNNSTFSPPSLNVALLTGDPGETGDLTAEVSETNYSRQSISFDAAVKGSPTTSDNSSSVSWSTADNSWGTLSHFALVDGNGNVWWYGALDSSKTVDAGDTASFSAGKLTIKND